MDLDAKITELEQQLEQMKANANFIAGQLAAYKAMRDAASPPAPQSDS